MKCADIRYEVVFASQQLEALRQCKTVGLQERIFCAIWFLQHWQQ